VNRYIKQYGIQTPDGALLSYQPAHSQPPGWDWDAYFSVRGFVAQQIGEPTPPPPPVPYAFDTRQQAEAMLKHIASQSASVGVTYHGVIVERLCSPFTTHNPGPKFTREITAWLRQQGGEA
jgi:hypothetical protein